MKKFLLTITAIFMCIGAHAKTETINWYMDDNTYATTQCETGSDIILPQTPYKYGYTFNGWIGYTPIEYLKSTGTQYIDTGIVPNEKTEVEIEFKGCFNGAPFFVTTGDWSSKNFGINFGGGRNLLLFYMNCDGYTNYAVTNANSQEYTKIQLLLTGIYVNDTKVTITSGQIPSTTAFTTTNTLPLFAGNQNGSVNWKCAMNLKYFKLWQKGVLVRDFIPVLDADGTPCLFDNVESKFYYNAGTGQFVAGPVITE